MFKKTNKTEIIEVISEEVSHNIPALLEKKKRLLEELAEIERILEEDKKFIKNKDVFERVSEESKIG
jgi:hypothetical protein